MDGTLGCEGHWDARMGRGDTTTLPNNNETMLHGAGRHDMLGIVAGFAAGMDTVRRLSMDTIGFKLPGNRGETKCPMLGVEETGAWLVAKIGKSPDRIAETYFDDEGGAIVVMYRGLRDRKYQIRFDLVDPT